MAGRYDSTGMKYVPIDDMMKTFVYNGDGTLNYVDATDGVGTWRQTYTYTSGKVASISGWVEQ